MRTVLFDAEVFTDFGQFALEWGSEGWDGDFVRFFAGQENGWVAAAVPGVLSVVMSRVSDSAMRVEISDVIPSDDGEWEDVVEVSITVEVGRHVWVATFYGRQTEWDIPPGTYRARVSAKGRDAAHNDGEDFYLIQLWQSATTPDRVIRTTSLDGSYWNEQWGGNR